VFLALDLDLLLEGFFWVSWFTSSEDEPEFINEVAARLLFLIGGDRWNFSLP